MNVSIPRSRAGVRLGHGFSRRDSGPGGYASSSGMIWPISMAWLAGASSMATNISASVAPVARWSIDQS